MSKFSNDNKGAIDSEVKNLIAVMEQKDMRRYKNFLFSMYNHHKIYVSIREFVWTHIRSPFLAESTCEVFLEYLRDLDENESITVIVTDMTLLNSRPKKIEVCVALKNGIGAINWAVNQVHEIVEDDFEIGVCKPKVVSYRYRHPEDPRGLHHLKNEDITDYSLGDLGFTDGSIVYIYPRN